MPQKQPPQQPAAQQRTHWLWGVAFGAASGAFLLIALRWTESPSTKTHLSWLASFFALLAVQNVLSLIGWLSVEKCGRCGQPLQIGNTVCANCGQVFWANVAMIVGAVLYVLAAAYFWSPRFESRFWRLTVKWGFGTLAVLWLVGSAAAAREQLRARRKSQAQPGDKVSTYPCPKCGTPRTRTDWVCDACQDATWYFETGVGVVSGVLIYSAWRWLDGFPSLIAGLAGAVLLLALGESLYRKFSN